MATQTQRDRLRLKIGATTESMNDVTVDIFFDEATEDYAGNDKAIMAKACSLAIQSLMAQAAKRVDFRQNETSESASQYLKNLQTLKEGFDAQLTAAVARVSSYVQMGSMRSVPRRDKEYPGS